MSHIVIDLVKCNNSQFGVCGFAVTMISLTSYDEVNEIKVNLDDLI